MSENTKNITVENTMNKHLHLEYKFNEQLRSLFTMETKVIRKHYMQICGWTSDESEEFGSNRFFDLGQYWYIYPIEKHFFSRAKPLLRLTGNYIDSRVGYPKQVRVRKHLMSFEIDIDYEQSFLIPQSVVEKIANLLKKEYHVHSVLITVHEKGHNMIESPRTSYI